MSTAPLPTHVCLILYEGFQSLDVFGPIDILNVLSQLYPSLRLSILAPTLSPISTRTSPSSLFTQSVLPTHTYASPPTSIDAVLLPGGLGARPPADHAALYAFLQTVYPTLHSLLTVCTGSALLAQTGLLDHRRATSNKRAWSWVKTLGTDVEWVAKARWVVDGNIWTSSGVAAGTDMCIAWVGAVWGEAVARDIGERIEYRVNGDAGDDPFAEIHGAK